jgi:hypothetical protein
MLESWIKNDNFDEKYHLNDRFRIAYLRIMIESKSMFSIKAKFSSNVVLI